LFFSKIGVMVLETLFGVSMASTPDKEFARVAAMFPQFCPKVLEEMV